MQYAIHSLAFIAITNYAPAADSLRAGIAVVDITPPVPFRMSGYFYERLSTGVKDPLHAKAVVFEQGNASAALVFCDLVGVAREISAPARRQASEATGIPIEHIAIAATHTHTGPLYFSAIHDIFHERSAARHGSDPYDTASYRAELIEKIVAAIVEAKAALQPVEIKSGYARADGLPFNRRFHMKDGTVRFNPGQMNPNIVRPAGPIDPQIGIVTLAAFGDDDPLAAIVSFAMHLDTVGSTEYSADYPKYLEDRLRDSFGEQFAMMFGAGTCGDINDIDVSRSDRRGTEAIGRMLGDAVVQAIEQSDLLSRAEPALAARSVKVPVPLQEFTEEEKVAAQNKMEKLGTRELSFIEQVEAHKIVDMARFTEDPFPLEVQVFRLTRDTAIVTLPAEIFVELGLAIKAASPFKTTLVVELTNDGLSYIPTRKAFAEGSYEVVNSRVQPGSGEMLVEAAVRLLKELE